MLSSVAVVGASLAGLSTARALRAAGFEGRLIVIGDEQHPPYDRPPLSKQFLAGKQDVADLALSLPSDDNLDIEWHLGARATALTALGAEPNPGTEPATTQASTTAEAGGPTGYRIDLADGQSIEAEGVVIATGARARLLPGCELSGVHTLRTLDDAIAFRDELNPGSTLVVVGGGFIGAEIAATATELGVKVTLVEAASTALALPLGERLGALFAALHSDRGVEVLTGAPVAQLLCDAKEERVAGVRLADGREIAADVVLVGIGSLPNTEWLEGPGIEGAGRDGSLSGGVLTDAAGRTNLANVVATGDVAATWDAFAEKVIRREHWTAALEHPVRAAAALLGQPEPELPASKAVPYFWSDQYGMTLQFAGHRAEGDEPEVVEGELAEHRFVVVYRREGKPVAVLGLGIPKIFNRWRKQLGTDRG